MLSRVFGFGRRSFDSLSEQEILALAISSEEDDGRIYRAYADGLAEDFPQSAKVFEAMAEEEDGHRDSLIELYRKLGVLLPIAATGSPDQICTRTIAALQQTPVRAVS